MGKLKTDQIVISFDNYENKEELWKDLGRQICILTKNEEAIYIRDDDDGMYVLEHVHDNSKGDMDWGDVRFMLVTSDEEDTILAMRKAEDNHLS